MPGQLHTQQAPVSAQCRFCSMSTSCSSHVASVFPDGQPLLVGAAGTTGRQTGRPTGLKGSGIPAPNPALSTRNVSSPVCPLLPPQPACLPALCVPSALHLHFSSAEQLRWEGAVTLGFLSGPASRQFTFLLHMTSFSVSMRHQLMWLSHLNPNPSLPSQIALNSTWADLF